MTRGYFKKYLGATDVWESLRQIQLAFYLAYSDIRQRYRRSSLGPFWITISTAVMIATIGIIFGNLFKSPMEEFLPFLAAGLIIWSFIGACISDATTVFAASESIIKQLPLPLFLHVERMVLKNLFIFFHNIIIFPFVCLFVGRPLSWDMVIAIPGLALLVVNLSWIALIISVICTRFRDLGQIVASILQVLFYLTPILWMPKLLPERTSHMILDLNPFYHFIEVVRAPLMNEMPSVDSYIWLVSLGILGWSFAIFVFNKYKTRVAYWL